MNLLDIEASGLHDASHPIEIAVLVNGRQVHEWVIKLNLYVIRRNHMKLAGYIRVSTNRQAAENDSIDGQKLYMQKWAKQNDHTIVKYYIEGAHSAFKGTRRVFEEMLDEVKTGDLGYQGLVVYSLSRFARNEQKRLLSDSLLDERGISFFSASETFPEDPDLAHLVKSLLGTVNEHQSRQNSKVVRDRKAEAVEKGYFVGGRPPYGYRTEQAPGTEKDKKILVKDQEKAPFVIEIFRLALEGMYGTPWGVKKIATHLNRTGVPASASRWTNTNVHRLLKDPIYIGKREYSKEARIKLKDYKPILYRNPTILDEHTFHRVQAGLKARDLPEREEKGLRSKSLLTGIVKCDACEQNMVISTGKSGRYGYYKCSRRIKEDINVCTCPTIPKKDLEEKVINLIMDTVMKEENLSEYVQDLKAKHRKASKADSEKLLNLRASSAKVGKQYKRLLMLLASEELDLDESTRQTITELKGRLDSLEGESRLLSEKVKLPIKKFGQKHIKLFVQAAKNVLSGDDKEATKSFLASVIKEIKVRPNKAKMVGGLFPLAMIISRIDQNLASEDGVPIFISKWRKR